MSLQQWWRTLILIHRISGPPSPQYPDRWVWTRNQEHIVSAIMTGRSFFEEWSVTTRKWSRESSLINQMNNLLSSYRLKMPCSWTRWKSNRKRMLPSPLPLHPTTKQLFSQSPLLGRRQMEVGRLVVRHTSTLLTAPRTCSLSPPRASWQQVSLSLHGQASGSFSLPVYTFNTISYDQSAI